MNSLLIIIILFYGINGFDVLEQLQSKNISCNLHDFVKTTNDSVDEYQLLTSDLKTYCTNSVSNQTSQLLCHMIFLELEIGCLLTNHSRPLPMKYSLFYTSKQICSLTKISLTDNWIWEKLSSNEKQQVGSSSINLCSHITSANETLRLARFFYKIAPRIRRFDLNNSTLEANKTRPLDSQLNKIPLAEDSSLNKTKLDILPKNDTLIENLDLIQDQIPLSKFFRIEFFLLKFLVFSDVNKTNNIEQKEPLLDGSNQEKGQFRIE